MEDTFRKILFMKLDCKIGVIVRYVSIAGGTNNLFAYTACTI